MEADAIDTVSPLAADLRQHNPDRYIATLFAPVARRESLIALYAFDHELARVQAIVTEPMAGLIRLQWWQDVIDGFGQGKAVAHPVASGLQRAIEQDGLDPSHLQRAINGRRQPFEDDRAWDRLALERYLLDIGGSITCAAAELLGSDDKNVLAVADRVGLVDAAWEQLHFLEMSPPDRKAWLPVGGLRGGDDETANGSDETKAGKQIADWALTELAKARREKASIRRSALAAFFPGVLAGIRLKHPFNAARQRAPADRRAETGLVLVSRPVLMLALQIPTDVAGFFLTFTLP